MKKITTGESKSGTLFSLNFASIKFRDFEKKVDWLECVKFGDIFYSSICSFELRTVTT